MMRSRPIYTLNLVVIDKADNKKSWFINGYHIKMHHKPWHLLIYQAKLCKESTQRMAIMFLQIKKLTVVKFTKC